MLQDNKGRTVLHYAAFKGFYPLLLEVKDKRVFSLQDKKGKTLFHMLIESRHLNANDLSIKVDLTLVDFSLIANIKDNEGKTALFYYVPHKEKHFGNRYILNILKKKQKMNFNLQDNKGRTYLHYLAMKEKNVLFVKEFIKLGALKSIKDKSGKTPLNYAKENKNKVMIKLLK